jgi:cell division protein FtsL
MKNVKLYLMMLICIVFYLNTMIAQQVSKATKQLIAEFDKLLSEQYKANEPFCHQTGENSIYCAKFALINK